MLKNVLLIPCFLLLGAFPAFGQTAAIFGGYQFSHLDGGTTLNGWNASVTGGVAPFLGITGDFSGVYKSGSKLHTYSFGPEVRAHVAKVRPFAHALFGGYTSSGPISQGTINGFAMFYGGGLDIKASPVISLRPGQFDWMVVHRSGLTDKNNFRYSAGLVLSF